MTRILGIDYGTKRIGLALSDGLGLTARPFDVVRRDELAETLQRIEADYDLDLVVVGLPTTLGGNEGGAAESARRLGTEVGELLGVDVEYVDERFTSKIAEETLLESGMRRRDRRETIDKVAATIILQTYLDSVNGNPTQNSGVEGGESQ